MKRIDVISYFPKLSRDVNIKPRPPWWWFVSDRQYLWPYKYGIQKWPVTVRIRIRDGKPVYLKTPDLAPLTAEIMFQGIFVEISDIEKPDKAFLRFKTFNMRNSQDFSLNYLPDSIQYSPGSTILYLVRLSELPLGKSTLNITIKDSDNKEIGSLPLPITTKKPAYLKVTVRDEKGELTSARVGVYSDGRFNYPPETLPLYPWDHKTAEGLNYDPTWPSKSKRVFYTRGTFKMAIRPGDVLLVIKKGIEYKRRKERFQIKAGETKKYPIQLERYFNLPKEGWYSADDHVHVYRDGKNNEDILEWAKAEDIHFASILQMGDITREYYLQYAWGDKGTYSQGDYFIRSGQENPRTHERGHILMINNARSHWDPSMYYVYEKALDLTHRDGGVNGYAHNGTIFKAERGLAIDAPLGKSDFIEVDANHMKALYDWWNLGFKQTVALGSDYPYAEWFGNRNFFVYV
ncbi:MAG: hypothetical protein GXO98_01635, partial [Nitrospirae bacterium]|nr:hypothetical protein [Nitrospirota bacterium]